MLACTKLLISEEETFDCDCGVKKAFNGGIFGHRKDNVHLLVVDCLLFNKVFVD